MTSSSTLARWAELERMLIHAEKPDLDRWAPRPREEETALYSSSCASSAAMASIFFSTDLGVVFFTAASRDAMDGLTASERGNWPPSSTSSSHHCSAATDKAAATKASPLPRRGFMVSLFPQSSLPDGSSSFPVSFPSLQCPWSRVRGTASSRATG